MSGYWNRDASRAGLEPFSYTVYLSADSHNDARRRARRLMRGAVLTIHSVRRYCDNGYAVTYDWRTR